MKYFNTIFYIFLFLFSFSKAQELPPIERFSSEDYGGGNQNWAISQAPNKFIYVGNNDGLLEFNGAKWHLYPSPNNTIIRAVKVIGKRIYTGCYMEFGYWERNSTGTLQYVSLVSKLKPLMVEDEHFWNIITYENLILFQSFNRIYFYNTENKEFTFINSDKMISKVFNVNGSIYYHVLGEGIYKIEEGISKIIIKDAKIKDDRIANIYMLNQELLIQTRKTGFYTYSNQILKEWNIAAKNVLKEVNVYSSVQLKDKSFVLGTISNGLIYLSKDGVIQYKINQSQGLSNNTVLSAFEDVDENIWLGLDNGINCINSKSPYKIFTDDKGIIGTVYTSIVFNNVLYLGTNQGLFYKNINSQDPFKIIKNTEGQVWCLIVYNNQLFCGHHLGLFVVKNNSVSKVQNTAGVWSFKEIPDLKNTLIVGSYDGLSVLQKVNGKWEIKNKIEGFNKSARFFEIINNREIWIGHGIKGVFKLKLKDDLRTTIQIVKDSTHEIDEISSLVKFKNRILFSNKKGVYAYDIASKKIQKDAVLSKIYSDSTYLSGNIVVDDSQKLWFFLKDNIKYVSSNQISNKFIIKDIPIPVQSRKGIVGFENITHLTNNNYLLGTANGYIIIDVSSKTEDKEYSILLNEIVLNTLKDENVSVNPHTNGVFKYGKYSIVFNYSIPEYDKYQVAQYQYKLKGNYNKWSEWSSKSELVFENLTYGNYNLQIRGKIGNKITENSINYSFVVKRPWYLSTVAFSTYFLLFLVLSVIIHKAYKRHYKKEHIHKQLESEQIITQIKNEQLNQDIVNKNRELAISTMSIIKKNEVLNNVKKELKSTHSSKVNNAIKLIDLNINNTSDWKYFEKAFNNADKDFLEKIKMLHPDLSPNDLRFCAYLRLNLTSKEIAPLLNISIKSVETRRYRLRKKLNLEHEDNLVSYIFEI
ncbi:LuxR family transcriptional regulator [Lutibacter sp.]|uniref:helix-turn-helix and ligand-binding sensor domain-containing protein n=1 Tax=Lutibacter sp. TaxID=1925666 RepID=UPI00356546C9